MKDYRIVMGKKHAFDVLIFVYENPGSMQKIITDGDGKSAKLDRLEDLVNAGLLEKSSTGENWTAIRYFVTEDGARIASGWLKIECDEESDEGTNHGAFETIRNKVK